MASGVRRQPIRTGEPREPNAIFVFDRRSGRRLTGLGNPPVIRGSIGVANPVLEIEEDRSANR
jgi:hypothetical protein